MVRLRLIWFDLTSGLPIAVRVLGARLGAARALRVLVMFLLRGVRSPFAELGAPTSDRERFTRHQLRPVLLLDAVLERDLGMDAAARRALLAEVVGQTGARFIDRTVSPPTPAEWRALDATGGTQFVDRVLGRFLNAEAARRDDTDAEVAFDVSR